MSATITPIWMTPAVASAIAVTVYCWRQCDDLEEGRHVLSGSNGHVPLFNASEQEAAREAPAICKAARVTPQQLEELLVQLLEAGCLTDEDLTQELASGRWSACRWDCGPTVRILGREVTR